jgi:hypothetical protein
MQNFGKIKNAFNNLLIEAVVLKDAKNKQLFGSYVKAIKENKVLKTQFLIYNNIENKVEENQFKAGLFLQENLKLMDGFTKEQILEANTKLASKINDIPEVIENKELYENISTLIFNNKLSENIDAVVEATSSVIQYITENKAKVIEEVIELPTHMITSMMVEKYNSKYSTIDESEFKIIKSLIDSSDEVKKTVYEETLSECIALINGNLVVEGLDLETKEKLLKAKEILLNDKTEVNEDYLTNISKLVDLKSSLQ